MTFLEALKTGRPMRRATEHCRGDKCGGFEDLYFCDIEGNKRSCWLWFAIHENGDWTAFDAKDGELIGDGFDEPNRPADLLATDWEVMP